MTIANMPKTLSVAAAVFVTGAAFGNAYAQGSRPVTLELGVGGMYMDLPGVDGTAAAISDLNTAGPSAFGNQLISRQPRLHDVDLEDTDVMGLLGLEIPINPAVPFSDVSVILEAVISSWEDGTARNDPLDAAVAAEAFELLGLDNTPLAVTQGNPFTFGAISNAANVIGNVGVIAVPGQTVTTRASADADYVEGKFMFAGNTAGSGAMTPRWSGGVIIGSLEQDYDIRQDARLSGFQDISQTLNEDLDTFFVGPAVGVDLMFEASSATTWHLSAELAALFMDSDLTARQTADWTGLGPAGPGQININVNDDEDEVSGRVTLGLGVEHDFGPMSLGLEGSVAWWSYVPEIENPKARVGDETGVTVSRPTQVHIDGEDMTTGQVLLTAKFPFH